MLQSTDVRTIDYDFGLPQNTKYHQWVILHTKNLVSGEGNKASLTITPYKNQVAGTAYSNKTIDSTSYEQILIKSRENELGSLLGLKIVGTKRYGLRDIVWMAGDKGFRPD